MAANINDKFSEVSTGTRPTTTTVASVRSVSGSSLVCDDLTGWTTDTAVHFVTYEIDGQGGVVPGTQQDMKGIVSGNTISSIVVTGGTDIGNKVGDVVQQLPTSAWAKDLADGLQVAHDLDGTLKEAAVLSAISTGNLPPSKLPSGYGLLGDEKYFTSSGTWNKPAGLKFIIVEMVGGGGGGGGAATTSSNQAAVGGGGGGGEYARLKIDAGDLSSSETVTVGAGGARGAAGNNAGSDGGDTSFGAHFEAKGGTGGGGSSAITTPNVGQVGGEGGTGGDGTADLRIPGEAGESGVLFSGSIMTAKGGSSLFGHASKPQRTTGGASGSTTPNGYGTGGEGGGNSASQGTARLGGNGAPGLVIVHEYF